MKPNSEPREGTSGAWFLVASAVLVASVGLVLRDDGRLDEVELAPRWGTGTAAQRSAAAVPGRLPVAAPAPTKNPYDALQEHWGERWDEVRAKLEQQGRLPAELPPIADWADIELAHQEALMVTADGQRDLFYRSLMDWPGLEFDDDPDMPLAGYDEATPGNLAKHLCLPELADLDQQQVYLLEERFADTNARLDGMIRSYMEGLSQVVAQKFHTGTVEHGPIALPQDEDEFTGVPSFFGCSVKLGGWSSRVVLLEEEHPHLASIDREIRQLRKQRRAELRRAAGELLAG